jgi:hypothetical protein
VDAAALFLANYGRSFYALMFADANVTDDQHLAVAAFVEGDGKHAYGVTTTNSNALDSTVTTDLGSKLKGFLYKRTWIQFSSSDPYAIASLFGRLLTVNFDAANTALTLMWKQEPGVTAELLTETQGATLKAKRINVFAAYQNDAAILQYGQTPSGLFIDSVYNADWFRQRLQTDVFNLFYESPTKVPQTDAGDHEVYNVLTAACAAAVNNDYLGPGTWQSQGFGALKMNDFLDKGYYIFVPPIATQNQADRQARKSVPFQIAAKESGALHSANILVNVNR